MQHAGTPNGGMIACQMHLTRLAALERYTLHAAIPVAASNKSENEAKLSSLGAQFHGIEMVGGDIPGPRPRALNPTERSPIPWESWSRNQQLIDQQAAALLASIRPDIIVIDHLYSALSVPKLVQSSVPRIVIIHNNETRHFSDQINLGIVSADVAASSEAIRRLDRFERAAYRTFDAVVVLSRKDVPKKIGKTAPVHRIVPCLSTEPTGWRFLGNKRLFYVGHVAHHPNKLAMEWLVTDFAPLLEEVLPDVRLELVGAEASDFAEPKSKNIVFHGAGDGNLVKALFREAGLLVAPIKNETGTKMKILEALSCSTPILGSSGAYSGLPSKLIPSGMPLLDLDDPKEMALTAAKILTDEKAAKTCSRQISTLQDRLATDSQEAWEGLITSLTGQPSQSRLTFADTLIGLAIGEPLTTNCFSQHPWIQSLARTTDAGKAAGTEIALIPPSFVQVEGLHGIEQSKMDVFRWTDGATRLTITPTAELDAKRLRLRFSPKGIVNDMAYEVLINEAPAAYHKLASKRTCTIDLPQLARNETVTVKIRSQAVSPPGDHRALSLKLQSATLIKD